MMSENENDLFNEVMLALAIPNRMLKKSNVQWPQTGKEADWSMRNTRQLLAGSTKFIVSDSLLKHAVMASLVPPKFLLEACKWGIPPIENMWIEWNEERRVELMEEQLTSMGVKVSNDAKDKFASERVGYHISPVKGLNMYSLFFRDQSDGSIAVPRHAFYIMNEEELTFDDLINQRKVEMYDMHEETARADFANWQELFGRQLIGPSYLEALYPEEKHKRYTSQIMRRMAYGTHPLSDAAYKEGFKRHHLKGRALAQWFMQTIQMNMGDARFLMTLMALINYPNILIERDQPEVQQRMIAGRRVPRNEMRVIELDLPKPRGVTRYQRMFKGMGTPKRQHVRRGHIRTIKHKDGTETTRWIPEMVVGDPSLGRIDHQYDLKTKGTKNADKI